MLPTAGLFLPETLHRSDRPMSSHTDPDSTRLKYFQRKSGQPKHEAKEAGSSPPATTILASIEDLDDFPSISTASRFADFVFTSSKAASDAHTLALLIRRVQQDVSEASRLYLSPAVTNFLEAWPDKKTWIDAILIDVRRSLNDVGSYMESFRVVRDDGGPTGVKRRFEWIAAHQKKLIGRQQLPSTCHQSLVMTINIMQTVELCGVTTGTWQDPIYEAPVHPWTKSDPESVLRGPYSRREYRMSQKNFSTSSMHLPHTEQDSLESTYTPLYSTSVSLTQQSSIRTLHSCRITRKHTRRSQLLDRRKRAYSYATSKQCQARFKSPNVSHEDIQ
jgi:hypothetical protein